RSCKKSHVLLPDSTLLRRRDSVEVIGKALLMRAEGTSIAHIAAELGRLAETVRSWLRAFSAKLEAIREHFTRWACALEPLGEPIEPTGSAFSDALSAIGVASRAAVLRFGPRRSGRSSRSSPEGGCSPTRVFSIGPCRSSESVGLLDNDPEEEPWRTRDAETSGCSAT
ncbi:hypothetical protein B1B_17580, partial [mine drainage metagenome]